MSPDEVLDRHLENLASGDVDAVMQDYMLDAVVLTPDGPLRGHDEIRVLFEKILTHLLPPGSEYELMRREVEDEVAYTVWRGSSENYIILMGTDTFVIRGGKIVYQTFAAQFQPKGTFKSLRPPKKDKDD